MITKELEGAATQAAGKPEDDTGLLDALIVFAKHKKLILGMPVIAATLSIAVSFVMPNVYLATTRLLPPQQSQSTASAVLSQLGGIAGAAAGAAGIKSPSDLYVGILKSRTVSDRLIDKYNLKKVYDTELYEVARLKLGGDTSIEAGKDGIIEINVQNNNKNLVAGLANGYVDELVKLTKVLAVTEAGQRRLFFEHELAAAKNKLGDAETKLKGTLDAKGMVSIEADTRALAETTIRLRAQVSAKEIELDSMRAFVTETNPDYLRIKEQLSSLRAELSRLENGKGNSNDNANLNNREGGLENIQVLRDVKYYQMLAELLAKQYEAARLDEAKDPAIIQVLDPAVQPERKFKPKRSIIAAVAGILGLLAATGLAFFIESKNLIMQSARNQAKWKILMAHLRRR